MTKHSVNSPSPLNLRLAIGIIAAYLVGCAQPQPANPTSENPSRAIRARQPHAARTGQTPIIAIANFIGTNPTGERLSDLIAQALQTADEERVISGKPSLYQVIRVSDQIRSHTEARACATKAGAELILWGILVENPPGTTRSSDTNVEVGSISAGHGATISIGNTIISTKPFTVLPRVTLRRKGNWIPASSRLDVMSLADVDFASLGKDPSLFLIPFLAATAAFENSQFEQARNLFEDTTQGLERASGNVRATMATHLGAFRLSTGDPQAAVDALDVAPADLTASPPTVAWQNRILLGQAREKLGDFADAKTAFASADVLARGLDSKLALISSSALATTLLRLGEVHEALQLAERGLHQRSNCSGLGEACFEQELFRVYMLSLKVFALGAFGLREEYSACKEEVERQFSDLYSLAAKSEIDLYTLIDQALPTQSLEAPSFLQMSFSQSFGCLWVHYPFAQSPFNSIDSRVDFDQQLSELEMSMEAVLSKAPDALRRRLEPRLICTVAQEAYETHNFTQMEALGARLHQALDIGAYPLGRVEAELILALAESKTKRRANAIKRVRAAIPALRHSMGENSPVVRRWTAFLATGSLPELRSPPTHASCAP